MITKIKLHVAAEDEPALQMEEQITDAFLMYAPCFATNLTAAAANGFRSLLVSYDIIERKYTVTAQFNVDGRVIYHTIHGRCAVEAVVGLARIMPRRERLVAHHLATTEGLIEFEYIEYELIAVEPKHPF